MAAEYRIVVQMDEYGRDSRVEWSLTGDTVQSIPITVGKVGVDSINVWIQVQSNRNSSERVVASLSMFRKGQKDDERNDLNSIQYISGDF